MRALDWVVLVATLAAIVGFGVWKTRGVRTAEAFLRGGRDLRWWTIGLSIMATQASAITFLSTPGQAYEDGLGFVQFYFGLPIAMVILSATIVPLYRRLKVYTAYEYLETRFDRKTRLLTAFLFLVQRGLGAGLSIYAPAIVLSTVLGWSLTLTNLVIGGLVIVYTVTGGTRVVSQTQTWQMVIMLGGMAVAFGFVLHGLPARVGLGEAMTIAGALGHTKAVDFALRFDTRYTFWSGLLGGLFVALAYFGTDQSQVQRYLGGASLTESRLGLLFNGLVKVPMQFGILMVGLMVFVFYQFHTPPLYWNRADLARAHASAAGPRLGELSREWSAASDEKQRAIEALLDAHGDVAASGAARAKLGIADGRAKQIRASAKEIVARSTRGEAKDADYVFLTFVIQNLPAGLVGLLLAVIFCAAMSATASALNALGSTSVVDFYKPLLNPGATDAQALWAGRGFTVLWGAVAMLFAAFASQLDNLIQAVNILGSLFYGPMLGVFLVGFFLPRVRPTPVFVATLVAEGAVITTWLATDVGFLWYNVIGCAALVFASLLVNLGMPGRSPDRE